MCLTIIHDCKDKDTPLLQFILFYLSTIITSRKISYFRIALYLQNVIQNHTHVIPNCTVDNPPTLLARTGHITSCKLQKGKHMTWRRCVNGYNLTQTILLIGKVTTVVQVVTSAVTADTLPISQTLELFRKTLSTTMWFTYIQTWSNILHPDYMKTQHLPNIKNNTRMPKIYHFNVFNCLAFISYCYTNS